jgi:hypothetical protein
VPVCILYITIYTYERACDECIVIGMSLVNHVVVVYNNKEEDIKRREVLL